MKRTVTTVLSLLFGSMLLYSCETCENPTITVPTDADYKWLVYKPNDRPQFENEKDSLINTFKFMGVMGQNVAAEGNSISDECVDKLDTQVIAQVSDTTGRYPDLYTYILKRPDSLGVRVAVQNRGDWKVDIDNPTYETLDVNGFTYFNVYEITPDSIKTNSVKKILFNKEFGFLQIDFYDQRQLKLVR